MKTSFILTLNGHVQVHGRGFENSQSLQDRISDPAELLQVIRSTPEVAAWTMRLRSSGLAASATATAGVQIMAVHPATEPKVTRISECVSRGSQLKPGLPRAILLGHTLALNLGVAVGDRIVLMAQRPDGELASEVFYLRGTLCSGAPQVDRSLALIPLDSAQNWLGVGKAVTDLVIRASSHDAVDEIFDHLTQVLADENLEVMRWQDLDPMVRQWLKFSDAYGLAVIFIVVAVVIAEVLNTMLMAMHERTRELAIMQVLGIRGFQLFRMMLFESTILVGGGAVIGYSLGAFGVFWFSGTGVDLSRYSHAFQFFYMNPVIQPALTASSAVQIIGTTFVAALFAGLYPAWRAGRIEPVAALRGL